MLPRHSVSAGALWRLLCRLLSGGSIKAAAQTLKLPFALETLYHLLQRLRLRLPQIRSRLCREQPFPESSQTDPLLQTVEHLQRVFPETDCAPALFQESFQLPLLG